MAPPARSARTALLRDVLEQAVAVARALDTDGRGPVPRPLRPVLTMAKLTPRALAAVDRAGDDEVFRAEVRAVVDPAELGVAGRLWLERGEGWADELDALVRDRAGSAVEGDAQRALARERRGRVKAEGARDEARTQLERVRADLVRLREEHEELTARARADDERAEAAVAERTRAVRELKGMEARHAQAHEDLRDARAARDAAVAAACTDPPPDAGPPSPDVAVAAAPAVEPAPAAPPPEAFDRAAAARAVQTAAGAAAALAASLADLSGALGGRGDATEATRPAAPAGSPRRGTRRTARPTPRRPVGRLPGGLHDDTPEAADHLIRLPSAALLVDGYNATMATWPGRSLPEQRQRLVAALDELESRAGVETTIVFDGIEERWARSASRRVHVHFTPAGIEADDVILDLVDLIADDRPVVVASDDRRVREGARRRGAHVIGIDQLRALVT